MQYGKPVQCKPACKNHPLKDKVVLITGRGSGLGWAIARSLITIRARVAIADSDVVTGERIEREIGNHGRMAKFFQVHPGVFEAQVELFRDVLHWSRGRLDIVIPASRGASFDLRRFATDRRAEPFKPPLLEFEAGLTAIYYTAYLALWYFNKLAALRQCRVAADETYIRPQLLFTTTLAAYGIGPANVDTAATKHGVRAMWKAMRVWAGECGGAQTNLLATQLFDMAIRAGTCYPDAERRASGSSASNLTAALETILCNPTVDGRAICVVSDDSGSGPKHFDLRDDLLGGNGHPIIQSKTHRGVFDDIIFGRRLAEIGRSSDRAAGI